MTFWVVVASVMPVLALPITLNVRAELLRALESPRAVRTIALLRAAALVVSVVVLVMALYMITTGQESREAVGMTGEDLLRRNEDSPALRQSAMFAVMFVASAVFVDPAVTLVTIGLPSLGMPQPARGEFRRLRTRLRRVKRKHRRARRDLERYALMARLRLERDVDEYLGHVDAYDEAGVFRTDTPTRPGEMACLLWVYRRRGELMSDYRYLDAVYAEGARVRSETDAEIDGIEEELKRRIRESRKEHYLWLANTLPGAPSPAIERE